MPDPEGKRRCDRCDFYEPARITKKGEAAYGFCRKYAPRPGDKQFHAYWPVVAHDAWCAEYFPARHAL